LNKAPEYPDLRPFFKGKVLAGESAGANVLSTYCYSKSGGGVLKCLGMLPVFMYPHFKDEIPFDEKIISESLEKLFLRDYEYRVISQEE